MVSDGAVLRCPFTVHTFGNVCLVCIIIFKVRMPDPYPDQFSQEVTGKGWGAGDAPVGHDEVTMKQCACG